MQLKEFRKKRILHAMQKAGADIIVASLPENIFYISDGYNTMAMDSLLNSECYAVYCASKDKLIYVAPYGDMPTILEHEGTNADLICFGSFRFSSYSKQYPAIEQVQKITATCCIDAPNALNHAIHTFFKVGMMVAIDTGKIPPATYVELIKLLRNTKIADATEMFLEARKIKHPDEIKRINASAKVAEQAMNKALALFSPGMTERDIQYLFEEHLAKLGAGKLFCVVTAGERSAYSDTINTEKEILEGMMIRVDFGCRYEGFSSDLARTAFVGEPYPKVVKYYEALHKGVKNGIQAMVPGNRIADVFHLVVDTVQKNGIPHYQRHHVGHGIGLEAYDYPTIGPQSDAIIMDNMTFCLETPYYELGWGGLQIEHTIAIQNGTIIQADESDGKMLIL